MTQWLIWHTSCCAIILIVLSDHIYEKKNENTNVPHVTVVVVKNENPRKRLLSLNSSNVQS